MDNNSLDHYEKTIKNHFLSILPGPLPQRGPGRFVQAYEAGGNEGHAALLVFTLVQRF